jgi:PKD repeat protein
VSPTTEYFTDLSTPGPDGAITGWAWDFGDGGTSGLENPSHAYAKDGVYTVTLEVTSPDGTASVSHDVTVGTPAVLAAAFAANVSGLNASFVDHSTPGPSGPITGWAWDFGDGNTSTLQNPTHTYATTGTYTVTLTVTGSGSDGTADDPQSVDVSGSSTYPDPPVGPLTNSAPIFLRNNGNVITQKLDVNSGTDDGIGNMVWPPEASVGEWTLEDCVVANIAANPPRSLNGTGEAGFWIGQKTNAARLVASNCAWMGMWTGAMVDGSTLSDFYLYGNPHIALYLEHITRNCTFERFKIVHAGDGNAINVEWWYADSTYGPLLPYSGKAGSYNNVFQDFDITVPAGKWAFFLDAGTFGCTIQNGIIRGAGNGINHPANLVDPSHPNIIDWDSIEFLASGTQETVNHDAVGVTGPTKVEHIDAYIKRRDARHALKAAAGIAA